MQKRSASAPCEEEEKRRWHRARLLGALGGICRKIERLQRSGVARLACRDVAEGLRRWRAQEEVGGGKPRE